MSLDRIIPSYVSDCERLFQKYFLNNIFNVTFELANEKLFSLENIARSTTTDINLIPKITHKIWLTNPLNPYEIPEHTLNLAIKSYQNLKSEDGWRHLFWTNTPSNIPLSIEKLKNEGVEIHNIDELNTQACFKIVLAYINQHMFPFACDILRIQVVNLFGGIYTDMGWIISPNINNIISKFEYVFNGEFYDKGIISHNFIATYPESHILRFILDHLTNPANIIHYLNINGVHSLVEVTSPRMFTAIFGALSSEHTKLLLITESEQTFTRYHHESWLGECKFGIRPVKNADIHKFKTDIFK